MSDASLAMRSESRSSYMDSNALPAEPPSNRSLRNGLLRIC